MPPEDSDTEEYTNSLQVMEEVVVDDDDIPPDDDDLIEGVDDIDFIDDEDAIMDIIDESKLTFQEHKASVFSIDVSKNDSPLVVSGGEDDKAFVWNYESGEILFECTGHKDSVICSSFSSDSKYVMTADMGGTVIVFSTSDGKSIWEYECSDIEWCKWHKSAHVLFAGTSSGDVYMWKIPSGDCRIYASHGNKTTCASVTPNGKEIVVGYEDGSIKKWDLKAVTCIFHHKPDQGDPILCLDVLSVGQKNGNLIAYGTLNGIITLLNLHNGKQIANFSVGTNETVVMEEDGDTEEDGSINCIESVTFSPCGCYIAGASVNGNLCIWDISVQRIRHKCTCPAGLTKLIWNDIEPNYIISACFDGIIRIWEHKTGEVFKELTGHLGNILDIAITSNGKYLLTAGDDSTARLFEK